MISGLVASGSEKTLGRRRTARASLKEYIKCAASEIVVLKLLNSNMDML